MIPAMSGGEADGGSARLSKSDFAHWLRRQVASCTPAAVVRFGDGEVELLEACPDDAESMQVANSQLNRHTGRKFSSRAVLEIKSGVDRALDEADVLGILAPGPHSESTRVWMDRLLAFHAERLARGRATAALAFSHLNYEVLRELPELLAGRRVSAVTCRDLKPVLEGRWGLDDVRIYRVPSQYSVRAVDGGYEAQLHEIPMWPDAYERVRSELAVRERGEVFLVGAGLFAKDLCIRIREQGGIALDMGSALDHIAGKLTRPWTRRVFALHADGTSVPDIATDLYERFEAEVDHDRLGELIDVVSPYLR